MTGMDMSGGGRSTTSGRLVENGVYSDERFIDMMVPHHLEAVAMARVALRKAEHAELKRLSRQIVVAQQREIGELKTIRKRSYGSAATPSTMGPDMMNNTGMMTSDELANAKPFDRAFIDSMIPHHASAITMASVAAMRTKDPEIRRLARAIVDAQSAEIGEMNRWLAVGPDNVVHLGEPGEGWFAAE